MHSHDQRRMAKITAGDLDGEELNLKRDDEIGEVAHNIAAMKLSLRKILIGIDNVTEELRNAATTYTNHTADTLTCMNRQKGELDQIASAMTEMSATAQEMAKSAEKTSGATRQATQLAHEGRQVVTDS